MAGRRTGTLALAALAISWISGARAQGLAAPTGTGRMTEARAAFRAHVEAADAALSAGMPAEARERIERAETMLLNARRPGGAPRAASALAAARGAIDRGATAEARAALQPLLARMGSGKGPSR